MKEQFEKIAQSYLGATPKDKGCADWYEMQMRMVHELMEAVKWNKK